MPRGMTTAVVDPETGMLADQYCPMSERVVMRSASVSNIKCLLHQPRIDTMLASVTDEFGESTVTTIPATDVPYDEQRPVERPYIEEVDESEPISRTGRPEGVEKKPAVRVEETYYVEYWRGERKPSSRSPVKP